MIIGHRENLDYLQKSIGKNMLSHAYLFYGPKSVGKTAAACEFAKALTCLSRKKIGKTGEWFCGECDSCAAAGKNIHPDILTVKPEEDAAISVSKIRELKSKFSMSALAGSWQAAVIEEAEKMNKESANALLKILEEPSAGKTLILTTSEPKNLLPTILSRVYKIKFNFVPPDLIEKETEKIAPAFGRLASEKKKEFLRSAAGRPGLVLSYFFDEEKSRSRRKRFEEFLKLAAAGGAERLRYAEAAVKGGDDIGEILGHWTEFLRDLMFFQLDFPEKIANLAFQKELAILSRKYPIEKTCRLMRLVGDVDFMVSRTNANPQLALETLLLAL